MQNLVSEEVIEINGGSAGKTSMILVGVHGNETCGPLALDRIISDLKIENGRLWIAFGNPPAILENERAIGANLNRMFKAVSDISETDQQTYEFKRAQFLKSYLDQSDALLDIHASSNKESKPFIICEPNSSDITELLPIDTVVYGFDSVEPGGTDYYMNSIGKKGVCVECGVIGEEGSTQTAVNCIYSFLIAQGHISGDRENIGKEYIQMYQLYITKTSRFILTKPFKDFEVVSKGQVIGQDGDKLVKADRDSIILFAHDRDAVGKEAFLLGEFL